MKQLATDREVRTKQRKELRRNHSDWRRWDVEEVGENKVEYKE